MTQSEVLHRLAYRHFPTTELSAPIDWYQNPHGSSNWVHHFLSLRWLSECEDSACLRIIEDFLCWLGSDSVAREFIQGQKRDHTSAIRLTVLARLLDRFGQHRIASHVEREIYALKEELLGSQVYKTGHNHGLLIDESLLQVAAQIPGVLEDAEVEAVLRRLEHQIDSLFDSCGYTLEHSVSYQEFNLGTLGRIMRLAGALDVFKEHAVHHRISRIVRSSKRLLGNALRDCGEYVPFGDSFRRPSQRILNENVGGPEGIRNAAGREGGVFVAPVAGFGFYRSGDWHLGMTCSNNRTAHKQDDELSIFIEWRGQVVIDDAGYSDVDDQLRKKCRQRVSHSTISILTSEGYLPFRTIPSPRKAWIVSYEADGFNGFAALAPLKAGGHAWRLFGLLNEQYVVVIDWLCDVPCAKTLEHRFLMGNGAEVFGTSCRVGNCVVQSFPEQDAFRVCSVDVVTASPSVAEPRTSVSWRNRAPGPGGFLVVPVGDAPPALKIRLKRDSVVVFDGDYRSFSFQFRQGGRVPAWIRSFSENSSYGPVSC